MRRVMRIGMKTSHKKKENKRKAKYASSSLGQTRQNQENLQQIVHLQGPHFFLKEHRLIFSQELNSIELTQWQKEYILFFDTAKYFENKMVRSNSGDWEMIFGTTLRTVNMGQTVCGRARWQEAEATRKDFNIAPTRQVKKFFTVKFFNVIQDAIPKMLQWKATKGFRTFSSSTFYRIGCATNLHTIHHKF